jgi:hypothetical protein
MLRKHRKGSAAKKKKKEKEKSLVLRFEVLGAKTN